MSEPALEVLYEDNHLLAVNKPAGLLTQPSGTDRPNLEDLTKDWVRIQKNKPGAVYLHTIHRLDSPVSGVVMFSRTSKALSRMNEHMRDRKIERIYHAVTHQRPPKKEATLTHYLRHCKLHAEVCKKDKDGAKEAILHYRVLQESNGQHLLELRLETGRYHQIRAQLGAINCPVLGDSLYGGSQSKRAKGIALHHHTMRIQHPVTKEALTVTAPYPGNWPM